VLSQNGYDFDCWHVHSATASTMLVVAASIPCVDLRNRVFSSGSLGLLLLKLVELYIPLPIFSNVFPNSSMSVCPQLTVGQLHFELGGCGVSSRIIVVGGITT